MEIKISILNRTMTNFLREYEFECLIDLIPVMDLEKQWLPLYREWNKLEYFQHLNTHILQNWIKYVYRKKINNTVKKDHVNYQKTMEGYPLDIKKKIHMQLQRYGIHIQEIRQIKN